MPSCSATAAQAGQGRLGGLLHHVAQIAGKLQLSAAVHDIDLHFQNFAAHLGPGQAVYHAHLVPVAVDATRLILLGSQQFFQVILCNGQLALHRSSTSCMAAFRHSLRQLALQHPDAGFPGVAGDDLAGWRRR